MRFVSLVTLLLFSAACAKSLPEKPGWYARVGRDWKPLTALDTKALVARPPTDFKAMQAVVWMPASDTPRMVIVGTLPTKLTALRRDGAGWTAVNLAALPHEKTAGVWELRFAEKAPRGLILIRADSGAAGALVNGLDVPLALAYGRALRKAGRFEEAETRLEAAIGEDPKQAALLNELALTYAAAKHRLGKARGLANDAIGLAADDRERALYYDTLGETYAADGDIDQGIEAIDRAITLDLQNPDFHTHLTGLVERVQEEAPDKVLRAFYDALSRGDLSAAEDLSNPFDVKRLDDADRLEETLRKMARGAPFVQIDIVRALKHGRVARYEYLLVSQDGGRRSEDISLQFDERSWKVSLP